jgi:hypothetical protein
LLNNHGHTAFGFLGSIPDEKTMDAVNENRTALGIRSVTLRNSLLALERELGLDCYLPREWGVEEIAIAIAVP